MVYEYCCCVIIVVMMFLSSVGVDVASYVGYVRGNVMLVKDLKKREEKTC